MFYVNILYTTNMSYLLYNLYFLKLPHSLENNEFSSYYLYPFKWNLKLGYAEVYKIGIGLISSTVSNVERRPSPNIFFHSEFPNWSSPCTSLVDRSLGILEAATGG